jgi:hypothetical protein
MKTSQICTTHGEGKGVGFCSSPSWAFSIESRKACIPPEGRKGIPAKVINLAREDGA